MGLFRRREPLHERLAREGGLLEQPSMPDPRPHWQETGIHGISRPREWDETVTVDAPEVDGDSVEFVVVDRPEGPLAQAVTLQPPFRARATRQSASLWAVQARRIRVVEIPDGPEGDTIELVTTPDGTTLTVDDASFFGSIPELEGLGDVVRATRLDGDRWEVQAQAL